MEHTKTKYCTENNINLFNEIYVIGVKSSDICEKCLDENHLMIRTEIDFNDELLNNLCRYYSDTKSYSRLVKYCLIGHKRDNAVAQMFLAQYYSDVMDDDKNMIYYAKCGYENYNNNKQKYHAYSDVISFGMILIGDYVETIDGNYDEMEKYYRMASELKNTEAMFNLGIYYAYNKKSDEMEKYYKMASDLKHVGAMTNLGIYYYNKLKKYDEGKKYLLMATDLLHGNQSESIIAMYNLGYIYFLENSFDLSKKYYAMSLNYGHVRSIEKLQNYYKLSLFKIYFMIDNKDQLLTHYKSSIDDDGTINHIFFFNNNATLNVCSVCFTETQCICDDDKYLCAMCCDY